MERLLIVDGNNLLFQMFYGMPSKIYNKSGKTIHATIGFISYILKQINYFNISKIVVVFDGDTSKERKELDSNYKSNRTINWDELNEDEVPFNEEKYIIKCLDYLNIKVLYSMNMEADDLIASLTKLFEDDNEILISSFDSDFYQLINNNVSVLRYRGKCSKIIDKDKFIDEFNFDPSRYCLYKAIVGDNSDNIKGVKGIGKVRGSIICKKYSSLEDIFMHELLDKYEKLIFNNKIIIEKNIKLIELKYKNSVKYKLIDFDFDKEKILMKNSEILSICKVFD